MSEELSLSSSSSALPSSSSKNAALMKRQNANFDMGAAGDFEESVEVKPPVVAAGNGYGKRRRSGYIGNGNGNGNRDNNANNLNDLCPSDTDGDGPSNVSVAGDTDADADASSPSLIGENQKSSVDDSPPPLITMDELVKMYAVSPDTASDTANSSDMKDSCAEVPPPAGEATASSIIAISSNPQPMESSTSVVDNDTSTAANASVTSVDNEAAGNSTSNAANTSGQWQPRIRLRRYRHPNTDASSTPSHEEDIDAEEADNVSDQAVANSQHHTDDSDDSVDSDDLLSPFIFNYDSQSSDNSYDLNSPSNLLLFDPSSEEDTNMEDDLAMFDDPIENIGDGADADADDDHEPNASTRRKSMVFGLVDKVLSKTASPCNWNTTMEVMYREYGMFNRFGFGGGGGGGGSTGRGVGILGHNKFNNRFYASQYVVERMALSCHLRRHNGCVNSLNFNRSGELLCSGSDDKRIIIWDWARKKIKHAFRSGHRENIFQTKFITGGTGLDIVSAGRDGQVRRSIVSSSGKAITTCLYKHRNAVHKLVICPNSPFEILSVGEDGYIRHSDLRSSPNSLPLLKIENDRSNRHRVRLFSIAHHPYAPEICVCGSDEFVRVYDKRKLDEPVHKMCPSHLLDMSLSQVTCCTYNHDGTEILATYSDEQIYLFSNVKYSNGSFLHVYRGHYNHRTIKGVNFFGPNSEYVISGSDCGNVFFWDKETEAIVNFMAADALGVVNCLEPHPNIPVLATSGLDYNVKIWQPGSERTSPDKEKTKSCIMRNIWRSGLEGRDILDSALNDIILEAFHPDAFDSDDTYSPNGIFGGHDATLSSISSSSSSDSTNESHSTENNDHQYFAHGSDDSSENEGDPLNGLRCQTQ